MKVIRIYLFSVNFISKYMKSMKYKLTNKCREYMCYNYNLCTDLCNKIAKINNYNTSFTVAFQHEQKMDMETVIFKLWTMYVKKINDACLAYFSPIHILFPMPNGDNCSEIFNFPS